MKYFLYLAAFCTAMAQNVLAQQHEVVVDLPRGDFIVKKFTKEQLLTLEKKSDEFSGLKKIESVSAEYPDGKLSDTAYWPEGAWGRGYQTWPKVQFYTLTAGGYYFACHPMIRDVSCFTRGHLFLFLSDASLTTSERLAKAGIDYLLSQQIKEGKNKGSFIWYLKRAGQDDLNMAPPVNGVQPYETAYALVALSEFYKSGIDYRRDEVLAAVQLSTTNLLKIKWAKDPSVGNSNMKALGAWSLTSSYQATNDHKTYDQIMEIAEILVNTQNRDSSSENGLWLTGGPETIDGYEIYHDTKIYYHMMNIRGLVEAFAILPDTETEFKWQVADAIKRAINHVILYRLDKSNTKNFKLKYASKTTTNTETPAWFSHDLVDIDKVFEPAVKIAYYSKNSPYFTLAEHISLKNLAYRISQGLTEEEVWYTCTIGYYQYYMGMVEK